MEAVSVIAERVERRASRRLGLALETVGSTLVSVAAEEPGPLVDVRENWVPSATPCVSP